MRLRAIYNNWWTGLLAGILCGLMPWVLLNAFVTEEDKGTSNNIYYFVILILGWFHGCRHAMTDTDDPDYIQKTKAGSRVGLAISSFRLSELTISLIRLKRLVNPKLAWLNGPVKLCVGAAILFAFAYIFWFQILTVTRFSSSKVTSDLLWKALFVWLGGLLGLAVSASGWETIRQDETLKRRIEHSKWFVIQLSGMTPIQKLSCVYLSLALVVLLYVPCNGVQEVVGSQIVRPVGYRFLFSALLNLDTKPYTLVQVDTVKVLLELGVLTVISGLLLIVIRSIAKKASGGN